MDDHKFKFIKITCHYKILTLNAYKKITSIDFKNIIRVYSYGLLCHDIRITFLAVITFLWDMTYKNLYYV